MKRFILSLTLLSVPLVAPVVSHADVCSTAGNLLLNCAFQTGNFTDWTITGNTGFTSVIPATSGYGALPGSAYYAYVGPVGSDGYLSQTFSDVAGQTYTIGAYVAGNGSSPSDFQIDVDGTSPANVLFDLNPVPAESYTLYTATFVGTGSDTVYFGYRNDPSYDALDDLYVVAGPTSPSAVPEPGYMALFPLGFAALAFARKRRQSQV
jgi:hypothetical protein